MKSSTPYRFLLPGHFRFATIRATKRGENQRTDEYGGSTINRVHFLVEVATAVRNTVGQGFTVGIRISQGKVNDYEHKWAGKEEDAKIIFGHLGQADLDFIHVI